MQITIGGTILAVLVSAAFSSFAQLPNFGRPGQWEFTRESKNVVFDGKPESGNRSVQHVCVYKYQMELAGTGLWANIEHTDKTCKYSNITGSPNALAWSYQCGESPKRNGKSQGKVRHRYDPTTETIMQQHSFSIDFLGSPSAPTPRWVNVRGEEVLTAKRLGECKE